MSVEESNDFLWGANVENDQQAVNPYVIDAPVVDDGRFFGREKALAWLSETLGARGTKRVVVVRGSYRIGKTSILNQLERCLPQTVFLVDLSVAEEEDSLLWLLWRIATSIATSLSGMTGRTFPKPELNDFLGDSDHFHATFLPKVYKVLRRRRLVLAFDEAESLEDGEGALRQSFYTYLSELMDGPLNLSVVLALEEWPEDPPSILREALRWRLGVLDNTAGTELITEPAGHILEYDYHAVRHILELTSGHPYFTQLVCYVVFQRYVPDGRVSARHVEGIIEEAMELASPYMERLWDRISPEARLVLAALASLRGARGILLEQDLRYLLGKERVRLSPSEIAQACQELVDRDVLEALGATSYRFRVELVRMWVSARRKLDAVVGMGRTQQVAATAGDWMGRFLWPLIGLLVVTALVLWCLASWQPIRERRQASATPVETPAGSSLSYVLVSPTPDLSSTATAAPTARPPSLDIVYMVWEEESGSWEIFARSRDGSIVKRLTDNDVDDSSPVWSRDHVWLTFVSERDGDQEIYRMRMDDSEPVNLTRNPASDWTPSVSPDGTKVLFSSLRDGNWELYLMDADGSQPARMTFNEQPDYAPAWSPDGSRIAFVSERDGNLEIYVMNADGAGEVRLTRNSAVDLSPAWSPDGSSIAFESYRDGNMEIYVMNPDGTEQRNLTNYPMADDHGPTWTGDGLGIVFYSNRDGNWDLYQMNPQGGEVSNLTDTPELEQEPFCSS